VRRCSVSIHGNDKELHTLNVDAASLYDAADTAIQNFCKYWWYERDAPVQVVSGEDQWMLDQDKVRAWRTTKKTG
jgi:hypothetical protein